jgi:hypothetical protein
VEGKLVRYNGNVAVVISVDGYKANLCYVISGGSRFTFGGREIDKPSKTAITFYSSADVATLNFGACADMDLDQYPDLKSAYSRARRKEELKVIDVPSVAEKVAPEEKNELVAISDKEQQVLEDQDALVSSRREKRKGKSK